MAKKPKRKPDAPVQVIHGALTGGGFAPIALVQDGYVTDLRVRELAAEIPARSGHR